MSHKMVSVKTFLKLHKNPLLIASIVKGAVSGLENHEKCLLFHLTKLSLLLANQILWWIDQKLQPFRRLLLFS